MSRSMSIQDRIRAMNETLDKVEAAPTMEVTEERTISSAEQQSALHSVENVSSPSSQRSSVVDMWRQREGPKTSPVAAERPKTRQVVVAPPFVQKRRSLVTSPDVTLEHKKDPPDNPEETSRNQPVQSLWQSRHSPVSQSPVSVPKPLWVSSPKVPKEAGGRKTVVSPKEETGPGENMAQLLKSRLPATNASQSPGSLPSPKVTKTVPSFKDHAPVDLTIVPSTNNDFEPDTRSTPGSRRLSDLVAVVSKHEPAEGFHHAASPSTAESPGTRRSSVVDFWKTRTAVTDRPPAANAPRKSNVAAASLKDVLQKRKEDHDEHDPEPNTAQQEKAVEADNVTTTRIADRWIPNTGNRVAGKDQDRLPVSGVPRTATLANSLRDVFEKRKEKETDSGSIVENHRNDVTNKLQEGADAERETGSVVNRWVPNGGSIVENHRNDVTNKLQQQQGANAERETGSVVDRWVPNGGARVAQQQTRPAVERPTVEVLPTANAHDEVPDGTSPHAISFKDKARLFEEKASQSAPSGPKKATNFGNAFKKSLGGPPGPAKTVAKRWNQNVVGKSSEPTSNGTATAGNGRLPQIPPMHPKKGSPMDVSPKSMLSSRKSASHDSATEEGSFSKKWEDDLSGPGMSSSLDPPVSSHSTPQIVANDSKSGPDTPMGDTFVPDKVARGTATHARSASTGSFGELLPDPVANPTPSLKRHARIPSVGSIGELGARYRASSVGSVGDVMPPTSGMNDSTVQQSQGATKFKDGPHRKNALSSRIVQSLLTERKASQSSSLNPNESTVLPKPLRFQKPNQEGAGGKDQSRNGDALVSPKESAFDSWPSKSEEGNGQDAQPDSARKRNRRNLASLGKRHIAKTSGQKNGDAYSVVSNPSSSMFGSQRSTQSLNQGTEGAVKSLTVTTSDWPDNAWPSEGLGPMFSLSVDSGSPGQTEVPGEIVTKKMQDQRQKKLEERPVSKKPSSTKSVNSGKFSMTDALDPIDEYQWSEPAVNNVSQAIPQPSEYTALHVSVSDPKWQSSDLSFGMKPSLHSPGFEDNKSDFSVFSDSAVSKSSSTSSLANRAERALQARRRKNRTYITTGTASTEMAHSAVNPTHVGHNAADHSMQHHSTQPGPQLHGLNNESSPGQEELRYRSDESYAQSLSEKRRAAGLMTTYKTSSRFMEEDDELELQSAPPPARKPAADAASVESGESSYRTLETATSESESPWSKGHTKRRSVVGPVPEKFIDESAENMDNFQKAFESLGLSQIASDLAREVRLATLDISNLAKGMNETVKTFRTPAYTRSKAMVPKEDAPFDEDVAIEVEYLEDYADDDESAMVNGSVDDFAYYDEQPFDQPPSEGRGTKSAYV